MLWLIIRKGYKTLMYRNCFLIQMALFSQFRATCGLSFSQTISLDMSGKRIVHGGPEAILHSYRTIPKLHMLAGVLIHPSIMGRDCPFFGLTIQSVSYNSTVVPTLLTVILMAYAERLADKVSPGPVKFFLKPLLTVLITAPISLLILGPLGYNIGTIVANAIGFLSNNVGFLAVGVLGAIYPLMVMTGMHHAYAPVALASIASLGYEGVMAPGALCANISQGGAAFAVFIRSKDAKVKSVAGPGSLSCVLGVSEPVMYGVTLQYRNALIGTAGGACGGLFAGLMGVRAAAQPAMAVRRHCTRPSFTQIL